MEVRISHTCAYTHTHSTDIHVHVVIKLAPHFILSHPLGIPQALMLEYPIHGSFHSFLVAKRRAVLSGDNQYWPGWTQRHIEGNVAEVLLVWE